MNCTCMWCGMRARCNNPNHTVFRYYGGRGIKVCDRWSDFWLFVKDMGSRPTKEHEIDRINNDGHYEPSNCHWVTRSEQLQNTRSNRHLQCRGETKTLSQWSREVNSSHGRIQARLSAGWTVENAINLPPQRPGKRKLTRQQVIAIRHDKRSSRLLEKILPVTRVVIDRIRMGTSYADIRE